ncbi:hypothetical protein Syun_019712 [Stephania yunnanensis]|uniref:GAG-pre-integrase domain-containing protein n=1 Tax=Stephania yunnanensis TaxID=152371 RepID=A0AAP0NY81_9MAGN
MLTVVLLPMSLLMPLMCLNLHHIQDSITKEILLQGVLRDGLYQFHNNTAPSKKFPYVYIASQQSPFLLWHRRLGHPLLQTLQQIVCVNLKLPASQSEFCSVCPLGKHHALPFSLSNKSSSTVLELIHTGVWGPSPVSSIEGFNYYISFIDDCTRFTWIFPVKYKSDAFKVD